MSTHITYKNVLLPREQKVAIDRLHTQRALIAQQLREDEASLERLEAHIRSRRLDLRAAELALGISP